MPGNFTWEEYVNLRSNNTFGLPSMARYLVRIWTHDVEHLVNSSQFRQYRSLVLGSGSNILLATPMFDGVALKNEIAGIETIHRDTSSTFLKVGGGLLWDSLVAFCVQHDLGGLENLSMIPGTVGAAPIQNIGAYGVEVSQVIDSVVIWDLVNGSVDTIHSKDCEFGYRNSIFKTSMADVMILSVVIKVSNPGHHRYNTNYESLKNLLKARNVTAPSLQAIRSAVCTIRHQRLPDPKVLGNAGSFFHNVLADDTTCKRLLANNPAIPMFTNRYGTKSISSSWLIEQCGWKGKTLGEAGCYEENPLIIVNRGNATATDILTLSNKIIECVHKLFDVTLVQEVQTIY